MATIFSRIIAGEIPSYRIAEDEEHYAFLDINPYQMCIRDRGKGDSDPFFDLLLELLECFVEVKDRFALSLQRDYGKSATQEQSEERP